MNCVRGVDRRLFGAAEKAENWGVASWPAKSAVPRGRHLEVISGRSADGRTVYGCACSTSSSAMIVRVDEIRRARALGKSSMASRRVSRIAAETDRQANRRMEDSDDLDGPEMGFRGGDR
jgi:hypothetical protein